MSAPNTRNPFRRFGMVTVLATLLSTLTVVATAGAASADPPQIPCPSDAFPATVGAATTSDVGTSGIIIVRRTLYRYVSVASVSTTFNIAYARVFDNAGNSAPLNTTIVTETSQTFSVTVTVGTTAKLSEFLTRNVSAQIVASITTKFGVTINTTVAPYSRLLAEYGVEAFNVTYNVQKIEQIQNRCFDHGITQAATNAPTYVEGWRLRNI
ncbi:hypothetical protein O7626_35835 [Micromonospora sp. WMMD1102]|uniref:hypothetical protein n=1 Tax=Micromonospora sp. WMMD1102 TaxID=3016105 RepID=UPI002415179F|nr:hypothetical protein [Micromonospora sp. WMMD1102]MDG4791210.1 hypothetical protein [Micromonospora sp. WMMD1102]